MSSSVDVEVNGRSYAPPADPVVVVCIDGSEPDYHLRAIEAGRMPYLESVLRDGTDLSAECAMPSFTNPNNISIATGASPAVHGICGNYFFDPVSRADVMMNDPRFLRASTIFAAFEQSGVDIAIVTAKDKLRRLLGDGLESGICFSAEKAGTATVEQNGIDDVLKLVGMPLPSVYSAELSEFAMAAGVEILRERRPGLTYLSLTDYVQHKYAPGTPEANDFYAMLDTSFAQLHELGAVLVITADHGMNAKSAPDGSPQVVYLQEHLDSALGPGRSHVVLPITDPYTSHHASLGSFAFVHLQNGADAAAVRAQLVGIEGVQDVLGRDDASERYELPGDRIGDLAVVGDKHVALGTSPDKHDLSRLDRPLRSHGGRTEQTVPLIVNRVLNPLPHGHRLRNFDAYWLALNFAIRRPS
ncbi:phosphonoacetate hydrolase [Phytoactinopolyspora halotolerans]|uniref:Phosphonoacetate hydrolase n=1 Tax=Phytoactinopolyspora halotolerans TaxID=1981512 RepID=A0A6L9SHU5_9ACTN|nr:phosphonoacetate hydrolase [Phytoactinopolyspora halotolerans]NEE04214.1 phosphonoacetate hydrolase [Phytoactinopolyspora halotolerans]